MDVWQLVLVGLVMLLGLLAVLVPGAPGPAILWAAVVWWALSDRSTSAWVVLLVATALLLLNVALRPILPSRRRAAPRQSLAMGGVAAMVGFFVVPVVGGVAGFVGGVYEAERKRLGSRQEGWASTRRLMRGPAAPLLVELMTCLLTIGAWIGALVRA